MGGELRYCASAVTPKCATSSASQSEYASLVLFTAPATRYSCGRSRASPPTTLRVYTGQGLAPGDELTLETLRGGLAREPGKVFVLARLRWFIRAPNEKLRKTNKK